MSDFIDDDLKTSDARTWTFNVNELNTFWLDAPNAAKSAVASVEDLSYRDLRARLINQKGLSDTYVVVVKVR